MSCDILFIAAPTSVSAYQGLRAQYAAVEPPVWALLLAESVRSKGCNPAILDANAEGLSIDDAAEKAVRVDARLYCLVVYGQNPNSGTVSMSDAVAFADRLKEIDHSVTICMVGSHASALPTEVLSTEGSIDIVLCNEGVYSLHNLLQSPTFDDDVLRKIRGIAYRQDKKVVMTDAEDIVPQARMDEDLPGYAWDLLPYRDKPLDLYRSHFWHAQYDHEKRTPFAALYTSLGCMFKCEFCMINIINRNDSKKVGVASEYSGMRFWSPEFIFKQIEKLFHLGVRTIRISDEMFLLNSRYFVPLCRMLKDSGYGDELNMWAYSRIDTARNAEFLELIRAAGIRWLALGIESGSRSVRLEASKGKFEDVDIKKVISNIESADIDVISNFLFGLPSDTMQSMQATLDLGLEICTTAWNGYPVIALPGSPIYSKARNQGHKLSLPYSYYSFLGYDSTPLPTDSLTSAEILAFRDKAFQTYHTHAPFLEKVKTRFGSKARENLIELTKVKLRRRLLEKDSDH